MSGYTVQSHTQECEGAHGPSDWGPKQNQDAGQRHHQFMEGRGGKEVAGEGKKKGIKADEEPKKWGNKAESNCTYTCSQGVTKSEVKINFFTVCWICVYYAVL